MKRITDDSMLDKLRHRPTKGPVKLSYAEADYLIDLILHPRLTREALRVLVDQAKRKRLREPGVNSSDPDGTKYGRPGAPVLDVQLGEPRVQADPKPVSGWRGNPLCGQPDAEAA